jgi:hypothetical protein
MNCLLLFMNKYSHLHTHTGEEFTSESNSNVNRMKVYI